MREAFKLESAFKELQEEIKRLEQKSIELQKRKEALIAEMENWFNRRDPNLKG